MNTTIKVTAETHDLIKSACRKKAAEPDRDLFLDEYPRPSIMTPEPTLKDFELHLESQIGTCRNMNEPHAKGYSRTILADTHNHQDCISTQQAQTL